MDADSQFDLRPTYADHGLDFRLAKQKVTPSQGWILIPIG